MTKLVKTDHAIVPATSLAGKVEEALANRSSLKVSEYPADDWIGWSSWGVRPRPTREEWAAAWARWADAHDPNDSSDANWNFAYLIATYAPIAWWGYFYPDEPLALRDNGSSLNINFAQMERRVLARLTPREREVLRERFGVLPPVPPAPDPKDWAAALGEARVDAVGPAIPLTVEPLNPVLRAEGSREIVVDTETDKQALGRMFRPGVPAGEIEQFEFASPAERQQAKVERFGMNAMVQGLAADKITKDLREWAMQSERVAERKNFVGTDFEALELRTLAASLVPTVTLPTESSAKSFDVKVVGEDGLPVKLSPEVEMPDLRVGCGAEFSVPVNGKTLRCTKWRGHEGDHSDKINGVPINWANK